MVAFDKDIIITLFQNRTHILKIQRRGVIHVMHITCAIATYYTSNNITDMQSNPP